VVNSKAQAGKNMNRIFDQLAVLNDAFSSTGFQFNLVGFKETVSDRWALGATPEIDLEMKVSPRIQIMKHFSLLSISEPYYIKWWTWLLGV
jgi:hypothetical protein